MTFYHIRYNIDTPQGAQIEKKDWLASSEKYNEQQLKRLLINSNGTKVSIVLHELICEEHYRKSVADASGLLIDRARIDINNLNEWRLTLPSHMLNVLNEEEAESNYRYRNIDKPHPLL